MPKDHRNAAPESADRAVNHSDSPDKQEAPKVDPPADHETASPESGDRASPTSDPHPKHPI
jgi:hypothetical protein